MNKSLFVFFALMMIFRSALADWMYVPSGSMNPTIVEGDRILVDKQAYGLRIPFTTARLTKGSDPQRGDIVIFASPKDGITLVKRIVGLPGDTVEMRGERLFINGTAIDYTTAPGFADADLPQATRDQDHLYATENLAGRPHPIMVLPQRQAIRSFGPTTVPPNQYLFLGDSRDNSEDSRYIGFVPRESIVGRAFKVAYSLDADRWYRPRMDRFLSPLY
ncbi:MAG: signal peptidase I [Rudaea sp.]|nr:signal peptidase I [Rudaea sp.]